MPCILGSHGQLLITKDSLSFYSFTKTGVYEFTLQNNGFDKVFSEYAYPLPSEIKNIPLRDLKAVISNDGTVYFLYPGGGLLFEYRDNRILRIDESFPHRNQFSGHFFIYKNMFNCMRDTIIFMIPLTPY